MGSVGKYVFSMPNCDVIISVENVGYETGDVNKDGVISEADGAIALRHISEIELIKDELSLALADINNNGEADILDITMILKSINTNLLKDMIISGGSVF